MLQFIRLTDDVGVRELIDKLKHRLNKNYVTIFTVAPLDMY